LGAEDLQNEAFVSLLGRELGFNGLVVCYQGPWENSDKVFGFLCSVNALDDYVLFIIVLVKNSKVMDISN